MLITKVQIKRFEGSVTKLKGLANITLDNMIVVHDIKILQLGEKMFLGMPSRQMKDGNYKDIVHPINSEVRNVFERFILFAYEIADKKHVMYFQMGVDSDEAQSLFEQKIEHFKIIDVMQDFNGCGVRTHPRNNVRNNQEEKNSIDENLMKWLES